MYVIFVGIILLVSIIILSNVVCLRSTPSDMHTEHFGVILSLVTPCAPDSFLLYYLNILSPLEFWSEHRTDRIWITLWHFKRTQGWECSSVVLRVLTKHSHEALVLSLSSHTTVKNIYKVNLRTLKMTWSHMASCSRGLVIKGHTGPAQWGGSSFRRMSLEFPMSLTIQTNSYN